MFPVFSLDCIIIEEGTDYSETSVTNTNKAAQYPGRAKASTFQVFTNFKASSLDAIRRKINYFNNILLT
jgi:hypothetical protein